MQGIFRDEKDLDMFDAAFKHKFHERHNDAFADFNFADVQ
jgi:hypothetical protein